MKSNSIYYKTPLWVTPFILINMSIPIISVEACRPWIIGILSSYITCKFAQKTFIKLKWRLIAIVAISILAWIAYYMFYLAVKRYGFYGGFIPF